MELNIDLKKIRNPIMWNLPLTLKLNSQCDPSLHQPTWANTSTWINTELNKIQLPLTKRFMCKMKDPHHNKGHLWKIQATQQMERKWKQGKVSPFLILLLICVLITLICNFYFPITYTYFLIIFIYLFVLNMLGVWLVCRNLSLGGKGSSIQPFPLT